MIKKLILFTLSTCLPTAVCAGATTIIVRVREYPLDAQVNSLCSSSWLHTPEHPTTTYFSSRSVLVRIPFQVSQWPHA